MAIRKPKIEIFEDVDGKCRVRLKASNGKILMSSEAYSTWNKAKQTAMKIWELMPGDVGMVDLVRGK